MPSKSIKNNVPDVRSSYHFLQKGAAATKDATAIAADVDDFQALINSIELLSDIVDGADADVADELEEVFEALCESTQNSTELTIKLEFLTQLMDGLTEMEEGIKYRLQKLKRRRERIAVRLKRIREAITRLLLHNNLTHFQTLTATLRFRQSAPVVRIDNEDLIPVEYIKRVVTPKVDKAALRKILISGTKVPGASLQTNTTLYIE